MTRTTPLVCILSTILIGLNAGFFYTWSFTIMQSLSLIDPQHAVSAMQTINVNIRQSWFAAIFFGAPVLLTIAGALVLGNNRSAGGAFLLAAALAVTTIGITLSLHVPLNNDLATVVVTNATDAIWSTYAEDWTNWNHVRMLTSVFAFIFALLGLMRVPRTRSSNPQ